MNATRKKMRAAYNRGYLAGRKSPARKVEREPAKIKARPSFGLTDVVQFLAEQTPELRASILVMANALAQK